MPVTQPDMSTTEIYTIGHSNHELEAFLALLRQHAIALVVDVRSQPYSRWAPQFNQKMLAHALQEAGIAYEFMGDSLGGRPADRSFYDHGSEHPNYTRLAASPRFQSGIDRLLTLAEEQRVTIMCSEGDPEKCHRSLLITPVLLQRGARVLHVLPDGTVVEARPKEEQLSMF